MRVHERTLVVQRAGASLAGFVAEWAAKHELTPLEVLKCLSSQAADYANLGLRHERHGSFDKKADEA